jgi:hypothetical protein
VNSLANSLQLSSFEGLDSRGKAISLMMEEPWLAIIISHLPAEVIQK